MLHFRVAPIYGLDSSFPYTRMKMVKAEYTDLTSSYVSRWQREFPPCRQIICITHVYTPFGCNAVATSTDFYWALLIKVVRYSNARKYLKQEQRTPNLSFLHKLV